VTSKSELNDDLVITDESELETAAQRCSYRIVQVHEAVRNAVEGKWDAPIFQRGFIWKPRQLRDLADSLYRDYPIGSLLLWKDPTGRSKYWIADGQHRLISLCLLFGATPFWWRRGQPRKLCNYALVVDPCASDPFHSIPIATDVADEPGSRFVRLAELLNLDLDSQQGRRTFDQIVNKVTCAGVSTAANPKMVRTRLLDITRIRKRPVMVAVLRHKRETEVLEVFERLSSGGMRFRRLLLRLIASHLRFRGGGSI
jgi:uncharacterized protein DUF262